MLQTIEKDDIRKNCSSIAPNLQFKILLQGGA